jgi:hypothetical protein
LTLEDEDTTFLMSYHKDIKSYILSEIGERQKNNISLY